MKTCIHAVEKKGKIYLTWAESNTRPKEYHEVEWGKDLESLEQSVLKGEIKLPRKPLTRLEHRLAGLEDKSKLLDKLAWLESDTMGKPFAHQVLAEAKQYIKEH